MQTLTDPPATLRKSLKLRHIVILGLGYMTPTTVFDTYGIVTDTTSGHVPAAYIVTLIAILFTAACYGHMVRAFPVAGSAYTYSRTALNPHVGFMVGWIALLDYIFLPMINVLLTRIYLEAAFPGVPGWIWIVVMAGLLTVVNLWSNNVVANLNTFLVFFQILVVSIFSVLVIQRLTADPADSAAFTLTPFFSPDMSMGALLGGAAILCFSFLGFDAVTTYAEETPDPQKTIPRAIYLVAAMGGLIFITAGYLASLLFPDVSQFSDPESASPEMAYILGGSLFQSIFLAGALSSTVASGIASHMSASRLLFAMGRENVLPKKWFGYVSPRFQTPMINVLLIGAFSLTALALDLATAIQFINFGALTAFTAVNLSVIGYYYIQQKQRGLAGTLKYVVVPLVGTSFIAFLWSNLEMPSLILGFVWSGLGLIYLLVNTRMFSRKPPVMDYYEEAI
ncbi:putrescine importer [Paenibacillus mucilaginosus]|uniref:APC family permease n=1 Tax=Paenibacillus mucilaginosus TaxID=61624 RepID=UPI003D21C323